MQPLNVIYKFTADTDEETSDEEDGDDYDEIPEDLKIPRKIYR